MATTGIGAPNTRQHIEFETVDAKGNFARLPGFVWTDTAGNPLTPLASGGSVVATGNVASGAADSGNPVKAGAVYRLNLPSLTDGWRTDLVTDANSNLRTRIGLMVGAGQDGFGNASIGYAGSISNQNSFILPVCAIMQFNGATYDRVKKPASTSRIVSSANTTNATVAKASLGDLFAIQGYNTTASVVYLKLYNKASAPTVGTDTPVKTIPIPPNAPVPASCVWAKGLYFSTGIAYALTGAAADSDTTAVSAGAIVGLNLDYQ